MTNEEHTAAYWMQKTMDAAHEAYDKLKDTADFKNAIKEAEAIKQRIGIIENKKITNGDRIRQMTDEELAEWFAPHMRCNICDKKNKPFGCNRNECKKYAIAYMKQEVSEDAGIDL